MAIKPTDILTRHATAEELTPPNRNNGVHNYSTNYNYTSALKEFVDVVNDEYKQAIRVVDYRFEKAYSNSGWAMSGVVIHQP